MPITQEPLGRGRITWLGTNSERGVPSMRQEVVTVEEDGFQGDMYRGMFRQLSAHDVDYIATDGVNRGETVLNLRQITIVEQCELDAAAVTLSMKIASGMLRENVIVSYEPLSEYKFSQLPPLSRMVVGEQDPVVLLLTEQNGPCATIAGQIGLAAGRAADMKAIRNALQGRRGQMAMVKSGASRTIEVGNTFKIFPSFLKHPSP